MSVDCRKHPPDQRVHTRRWIQSIDSEGQHSRIRRIGNRLTKRQRGAGGIGQAKLTQTRIERLIEHEFNGPWHRRQRAASGRSRGNQSSMGIDWRR